MWLADSPAHDGSDAGVLGEFTLRYSSSWLTFWGFALFWVVWAACAETGAARAVLWYLQHSLHRIFWPLLLSISGSSAASRVLPAPAVLPTATSSTADGLTFLAIDAKGGEGALECLDLGGAHGDHLLSASTCHSCLFVLNYCITCLWFMSSLNLVWDLCLDLNIWLVMCDELW